MLKSAAALPLQTCGIIRVQLDAVHATQLASELAQRGEAGVTAGSCELGLQVTHGVLFSALHHLLRQVSGFPAYVTGSNMLCVPPTLNVATVLPL